MLHSPLNSPARSTCTRLLSRTLARTDKKAQRSLVEAANSPHSLLDVRARARAVPWAPHSDSLHSPRRAPAQPAEAGQRGPRRKPHPGGRDLAALAPASSKALACTAALATVAPAGDRGILSWDPHSPHSHDASAGVSIPVHENSERVLCDAMRLATRREVVTQEERTASQAEPALAEPVALALESPAASEFATVGLGSRFAGTTLDSRLRRTRVKP